MHMKGSDGSDVNLQPRLVSEKWIESLMFVHSFSFEVARFSPSPS